MSDSFWEEAHAFSLKYSGPVYGNRALSQNFGNILSFDTYTSRDAADAVIFHKGLVDEVPSEVVHDLFGYAEPVFANEVFVGFEVGRIHGTDSVQTHLGALFAGRGGREAARRDDGPQRPAVYLGDHLLLTKTILGQKLYVDTRDKSLAPHIALDGYWELPITRFIRSTVKPGMTAVEIGSNFGYYSVIIADLVGPDGCLFAFDANPHMSAFTRRNIEINGLLKRSRIINKAVSDRVGTANFHIFRDHMCDSSLLDREHQAALSEDSMETTTVETTRLQDVLGDNATIDFLKIDAEGAEPMIFSAAWPLITANPGIKMVVEFCMTDFAAEDAARGYLQTFLGAGFALHSIEADSRAHPAVIDDLLARDWCELYICRV